MIIYTDPSLRHAPGAPCSSDEAGWHGASWVKPRLRWAVFELLRGGLLVWGGEQLPDEFLHRAVGVQVLEVGPRALVPHFGLLELGAHDRCRFADPVEDLLQVAGHHRRVRTVVEGHSGMA